MGPPEARDNQHVISESADSIRTCIYFSRPHTSLEQVRQAEQTRVRDSTVFLSAVGTPEAGRGR